MDYHTIRVLGYFALNGYLIYWIIKKCLTKFGFIKNR